MTERQGLLIKAERFLASARLLAESSDLDSAVSRVYYAAFYVARPCSTHSESLFQAIGASSRPSVRSLPRRAAWTHASIGC